MAKYLFLPALLLSMASFGQTKGYIDKKTKEFWLTANIRADHKIFGYSSPSVSSKKLILFSVFTSDVKDNPYQCPLGAYYQTSDLKNGDKIIYKAAAGKFYKMEFIPPTGASTYFYFEKRNIKWL